MNENEILVGEQASTLRKAETAKKSNATEKKKSDPKKILIIGGGAFIGFIAVIGVAFAVTANSGHGKGNMTVPEKPILVEGPNIPKFPPPQTVQPITDPNSAATTNGGAHAAGIASNAAAGQAQQKSNAGTETSKTQVAPPPPPPDYGPAIERIGTQIGDLAESVNTLRAVVEKSIADQDAAKSIAKARLAKRDSRPDDEAFLQPAVPASAIARNIQVMTIIGNRAWLTVNGVEFAVAPGERLPDGREVAAVDSNKQLVRFTDRTVALADQPSVRAYP